ncbi:DUF302 domain-containing protein [Henriciella marina]|uniref:DUF302 domain-containing protein n=1 Tax=Henriciella marina TaxID=453851 RepID=UPI00036BAB30|nr:DUF302 domain-containing protein [Henriciella marina]
MKQTLLAVAAFATLTLGACQTDEPRQQAVINPDLADQPAAQALVAENSAHDYATTVTRLQSALEARPVTIFAKVDHAEGARGAGMQLAPSALFIFGNPQAGTPLMQANPALGLELPMKILVLETENGVQILRQDISAVLRQYGVEAASVNAAQIEETLAGIVAEAAG